MMRYEPVGYVIEYEICALFFLAVIMGRYFVARRFPNQKNRLFALINWVIVGDMVLDVVSSLVIDNVFGVPVWLTHVVNTVFYTVQLVMPVLMTLYTLAMVGYIDRKRLRQVCPLFLPFAAVLLLLLSNPLTKLFFYVDPVRGYLHAPLFILMYVVCLFYMAVTFYVAFVNRCRLRREEYTAVFIFLAVVLVAMAFQYFFPAVLVTGVAMALAVILMYFTIQNPDAMIDNTTGAFTSEAMLTFLGDRSQEGSQVQMVAVQIQNMRRINDLLGVQSGNRLLRQMSEFLRSGGEDIWVFRMRGSVFVAITRKYSDYAALRERVERRISQTWQVGSTEILIQAAVCSVSEEELLPSRLGPEEAVDFIETALLHNERSGKRVTGINAGRELLQRMARSRAVEQALREAIDGGEGLELYFQPLWSARQRRFASAEVLLRFHHPLMGDISPQEFVPIAESNGLVTAMDELVLRKACRFLHGLTDRESLGLKTLEVNLSAMEFMHRQLPQLLSDIMEQYQVDAGSIIFEITETAATESFELLQECMRELSGRGCRFALDDFGTGYANIAQVIQLPFSLVKLDRSLLLSSEIVLEDMARMFARMELLTVLEGVETEEQAATAERIDVDFVQGFYYALPMCEDDFVRFLRERAPKDEK